MSPNCNVIQRRTCGNCVAFYKGECMNMVSIKTGDGQYEQPTPGCCCSEHKTLAEDQADDAAMALFRTRIGLPPRAPNNAFDEYED